jgi:hypothetical protein
MHAYIRTPTAKLQGTKILSEMYEKKSTFNFIIALILVLVTTNSRVYMSIKPSRFVCPYNYTDYTLSKWLFMNYTYICTIN